MKDLTDKTKWSLKDLKTLARPTDRSHRVTVELLFDGRKVGYAHNPGNGCATVVSLKVQDVKLPSQADMVSLVDDLVEREVALRNLTRRHKSLMQQILSGYVYVLYVDKLKAWEAGEAQQESPEPQFSVFRCPVAATKHLAGVECFIYTDASSAELWEMLVHCDLIWRARLKLVKQHKPSAPLEAPRDPFLGNHYVSSPQQAEEIRRLEIGRTLEMSRYGDLPLTATARIEAMKLLGSSGMLVDDEIPTQALLELYIQYVVPHLPPSTPGLVDD